MDIHEYNVIGLMSGTSLDGLDIAHCSFKYHDNKWSFKILEAETIFYSETWVNRLKNLSLQTAFEFVKTNIEYGHLLGSLTKNFIEKYKLQIDLIASHGHTIFHQPQLKITSQIGDGAAIASHCNIPIVCNFRTLDVALGGQGAPLVPIGDQLLFSEYTACLNLGGIANVSFEDLSPSPSPKERGRVAFDICPVNIVANELAQTIGKKYDDAGKIGASGKINTELLNQLNAIDFYFLPFPKSLGREWIDEKVFPIINSFNISIEDKLCTFYEHIAIQISNVLNRSSTFNVQRSMLFTGGGAYNSYLIERIKKLSQQQIAIPEKKIIEFKEALIFAFLGVLRIRGEINCLSSVTGAQRDSVGGAIYKG